MSTAKFGPISDKEYDRRLAECLSGMEVYDMLQIPGIYQAASEHFNNVILEEYEDDNDDFRSFEDVQADFEENVLPYVVEKYGKDDEIAIREAWNDYTDGLCKDGEISEWAYENWDNPY